MTIPRHRIEALLAHRVRKDWMDDAACRGANGDLFVPHHSSAKQRWRPDGLAYCRRCPVIADCAAVAVNKGYDDAIYGGLLPDELAEIKDVLGNYGTCADCGNRLSATDGRFCSELCGRRAANRRKAGTQPEFAGGRVRRTRGLRPSFDD